MSRLGKRERMAKRLFETAIRIRNEGFVALNLATPKPKPSEYVATRTGFVARSRDETRLLMGNCHTRGIRIGSQLPVPPRPLTGKASHPRIGQITGTPKKR